MNKNQKAIACSYCEMWSQASCNGIISKLSNIPNLNSSDLDENFIQTINPEYYKTHDLPKISNHHHTKDFSIFHVNIISLSKHFYELHTLLHASK